MFLISGGKYSKSLSPKYKARRVSKITTVSYCGCKLGLEIPTKLEEISRQNVLVQVVVRQVQHLKHWERTEAAKSRANISVVNSREK